MTRRHPAEVTADRLADTVNRYTFQFTPAERDAIGEIIQALIEITEGKRREERA